MNCYDGQPIVKPCSFESIIRVIKPNLFKTSPYPLICSIENHCSDEQQKEIARIVKEVLREYLVTDYIKTKYPSVLPSPEELKYKVLIRSVKASTSATAQKFLSDKEISDQNLSVKSANRVMA